MKWNNTLNLSEDFKVLKFTEKGEIISSSFAFFPLIRSRIQFQNLCISPSGAVWAWPSFSHSLLLLPEQPQEASPAATLPSSRCLSLQQMGSASQSGRQTQSMPCPFFSWDLWCCALYNNKLSIAKFVTIHVKKFQLILVDRSYLEQWVFYLTAFVHLVSMTVVIF